MDTDTISTSLATLATGLTLEALCAARDQIDNAKAILRQYEKEWDDAAFQWVSRHGDFQFGAKKYYLVVRERKVKCPNPGESLMALMEITGGDADAVSECLSANAFKEAATREAFEKAGAAKRYGEHFVTTYTDRLASKAAVGCMDTRYLK